MQRKTKKSLSVILALALVVGLFAAMPLMASAVPPAPNAQIDYVNERFTNLTPGTNYSMGFSADGYGGGGGNYAADLAGTIGIYGQYTYSAPSASYWFGRTIRITEANQWGGDTGGDTQALPIPARPAAPAGIGKTDETAATEKDGTLTGVTAAMEYKLASSSVWISCVGTTVSDLAPGDYQVRYKAIAATAFASEFSGITVGTADLTDYTFNTPAAVTVNGVTATVDFDPVSPQAAGSLVQVYYSLSGTTVAEGYNTFIISSEKAGFEFIQSGYISDGVDTSGWTSEESETYFTMPSENVDDFNFTLTFTPGEYTHYTLHPLTANGTDGSVTTTALTVETENPTLSASDISVLGATKGALTYVSDDGYIYVYTLNISNITVGNGGLVAVEIDFVSHSHCRNVQVWVAPPPPSSGGGSPTTYTVSFNSNGGSAVASQSVAQNGKATQPASPTRDGFVFAGWYTDAALSNAYDFNRNVTASITLYAKWTEVQGVMPELPVNPFTDVTGDDWFIDDLIYVVSIGLVKGKTLTSYAPDDNFTYAEAVTLAARMHQLYTTGDITLDNGSPVWYQSYIDYALENGIIDNTDYDWDAPATRADYVGIFANALPDEALPLINEVADGSIPDVPMDHPQAAAIYKLYRVGILEGVDDDHYFLPDTNIKRSEIAVVAARMMNPEARVEFSI